MARDIDSQALVGMNRLLNIAGSGQSSSQTELLDDSVTQTIDITDTLRRSRTFADSTGWYLCVLRNVHSAADDEFSEIDPYHPGAMVNPTGGYPATVPNGFDVWICGGWVSRSSGSGQLTGGQLDLDANSSDQFQGWGRDDTGVQVATGTGLLITQWALMSPALGAVDVAAIEVGTGKTRWNSVQRIRRGLFLRFGTTSAAAATYDCNMLIGLFPGGVGQDIVPS